MNSTPFELTRCKNKRVARPTGYTVGLLKLLGVPRQMLYVRRLSENGSFWLRKINHLEVLEQARQRYRMQIVCAHPDKAGGSHARAIQLNETWNKIRKRFKEHGHELW